MNIKKALSQRIRSEKKVRDEARYVLPTDEQLLNFVCVSLNCHSETQREIIKHALTTEPQKSRWLEIHKSVCDMVTEAES